MLRVSFNLFVEHFAPIPFAKGATANKSRLTDGLMAPPQDMNAIHFAGNVYVAL